MTDIVKSNINELDIYKKYIHQRLPPSNIPLVYNNELDITNIENVLLIDSSVSNSDIFYNSQ